MSIYEIPVTTPKNPLKCHNLLSDVKSGTTEFTPEFAMEFMQSTDNRKNISDFLAILETHLAVHPETASEYQRVLLGIAARTNQTEETINKAKTLSVAHKITGLEISITQSVFKCENEDFKHISKLTFGKGVCDIHCEYCDLSKTALDLKQIGFLTRADFTDCKMPSTVDLSAGKIWGIYFNEMDMTSFNIIYPEEVQWLYFQKNTKLPSVIDLSKIKELDQLSIYGCDIRHVEEIKFPQSLKKIFLMNSQIPAWLNENEALEKHYDVFIHDCTISPEKIKQKTNVNQATISIEKPKLPPTMRDKILQKLRLLTKRGR